MDELYENIKFNHPRQENNMRSDFRNVFLGSQEGKRVLGDLLKMSNYFGIGFSGNSGDFYKKGQRDFVSLILQLCGFTDVDGLRRIHELEVMTAETRKQEERA